MHFSIDANRSVQYETARSKQNCLKWYVYVDASTD